jgi:cell division protein FtsB
MKTKQKIIFWLIIVLILLIFLAYFFIRYNNQIETLSTLSDLKTKQKELEQQLVKINQRKQQLQNEINELSNSVTNLQKNMNFRTGAQNTIQIKNMNETLVNKQTEIKTIDANIDKTTKEIEILKKIIAEPFDILFNDITNYPADFIKPKKDSFIMNSIMSGMPDVVSNPTKLDVGNTETVSIANDSKTNTILVFSPTNNSSFPNLFTIDIKYSGDKTIWGLSTADKNNNFMPNYQYNNEIIESKDFSSKFIYDKNIYEIGNKNIKMANVNLGNKIMCITTTGDVLDRNNNTYAKVEMSFKGMKIEFLNEKETISGIIIVLSPKIATIQLPE